jgi:hypothetical protein
MVEPTSLVLEHLSAIRAGLSVVREVQGEHSARLTELAVGIAGLRRDQAHDAEVGAHLAARIDRLQSQVDRINLRLELSDG